jgi:hypothetical protein
MLERPYLQSELIGAQLLKRAEQKSSVVNKKYTLEMAPFIQLYTRAQVLNDYTEVAKKRAGFENNNSTPERLGKVFESAFLDSANNHQWFGKQSEIVKSSLYDDFHGVDMIVTMMPEGKRAQNFLVSSDLTFSNNSFGTKFELTLRNIQQGNLATVKYFHSDLEGFTGQKTNVPRTIIGLDKNNLPEMLRKWIHSPEDTLPEYRAILLHQLNTELIGFRNYIGNRLGTKHRAYMAYDSAAEVMSDVVKKDIPESELPPDTISTTIREAIRTL